MSDIKELYQRLRSMPWPVLAGSVGHFPLYETLLAGYADRVALGDEIDSSNLPDPDDETVAYVYELRLKADRSEDETYFLEYFDLLEEIRASLAKESPSANLT